MSAPRPIREFVPRGLLPTLLFAAGCAVFGRADSTLPEHMDGHWTQADQMRAALLFGDLDGSRESARWLAEHAEHPALPKGVLSPVEDMRAFARSVLRADIVADAARCTSEMAGACGRCHRASGTTVPVQENTMPASGLEPARHMLRHKWAADRMWEGLVAPSDRMWELGATALIEEPLFAGDDAEVQALARKIHGLGATARGQPADHRPGIYARLVATCAECHALMSVGRVALDG